MTEAFYNAPAACTIRPAHPEDYAAILQMCHTFWQLTWYDDPFDPDHVLQVIENAASQDLLLTLEAEGVVEGFAAALALPLLANPNVIQVTELAFWINPAARGCGALLRDALERAARLRGAKYLNMIALTHCRPKVAERIYLDAGHEQIETVWGKRLEGRTWP